MAELKDKIVNLEDLKEGINAVCIKQIPGISNFWKGTKAEYDALTTKDTKTLYYITDDATSADVYTKTETDALLLEKLDASKSTIQTTAPTEAITDGGIHIVFLESSTGVTEYNGYIYMYKEA